MRRPRSTSSNLAERLPPVGELADAVPAVRASQPERRLTPQRKITMPEETREHLVTEDDLTRIENGGDGALHNWALMFMGGAISSFVPFAASLLDWIGATKPTSFVSLANIVIFLCCTFLALFLMRLSPRPNRQLRDICDEIRKRPTHESV